MNPNVIAQSQPLTTGQPLVKKCKGIAKGCAANLKRKCRVVAAIENRTTRMNTRTRTKPASIGKRITVGQKRNRSRWGQLLLKNGYSAKVVEEIVRGRS